jgi:hypothetical protein
MTFENGNSLPSGKELFLFCTFSSSISKTFMRKNQLIRLIYGVWLLLLTYYILQFGDTGMVPLVCASILWLSLLSFFFGTVTKKQSIRKISLGVVLITLLAFMVYEWLNVPACGCFSYNWTDFIPVFITCMMLYPVLKHG